MEHFGQIIKTEGDSALVQLSQSTRCADCKACEMFNTKGPVQIKAKNLINAQVGEQVKVEIAPAQVVGHSVFVFLFPVLALILGYAIGVKLAPVLTLSDENSGIIGAVLLLSLSFIVLYFYDRSFTRKKKSQVNITAVSGQN